jgi:parallel beta-helix repeat protein
MRLARRNRPPTLKLLAYYFGASWRGLRIHPLPRWSARLLGLAVFVSAIPFAGAQSGILTAQADLIPAATVPLVIHSDTWRYRRGTNEPPSSWTTMPDAALDGSWGSGPGGLGYGDGDDATLFPDMQGSYLILYVRQSFEISPVLDPSAHLQLIVDWDDGFIAYLDGMEVARSVNVPGAPGTPHPFDQDLNNQSHEASAGAGGNPPLKIDLGLLGDRLQAGTHILAIQAINDDINSSDLSLIADLSLAESDANGNVTGELFCLTTQDTIRLSGTNTLPGSARVVVNGLEATANLAAGTWSRMQSLDPGMNRLHVAALDSSGVVLTSTNLDVVFQETAATVGGRLEVDTTWTRTTGVVRVVEDLFIDDGATLTIDAGVVVLLAPNVSIQAWTNSTVRVLGTEDDPVFFLPSDGTTPWGELSSLGSGATLRLQQADVAAGQVRVLRDAVVAVEDSVLRDMHARQMVEAFSGDGFTFRRTHFNRFAQTHFDDTPVLVEDCLIENFSADATDFQAGTAPVLVRRNTYRFGTGSNTDAVDTDFGVGMRVEDCLIHDIPDKAISIADLSHETIVHNNLIYDAGTGISCYASSNCVFTQNTVANCDLGLRLYLRPDHPGPAYGTATNNIFWDNIHSVSVTDGSRLDIAYSDISGVEVYPGTGNINSDPLFLDPANHDFRLAPGSPAAIAGLDGVPMGVRLPVGGICPAPANLGGSPLSSSAILLTWTEDADNEAGFIVERATEQEAWQAIGAVSPNVTKFIDSGLPAAQSFSYRVRATNASGLSRPSNQTRIVTQSQPVPTTVVGGVLAGNTAWTTNLGVILVLSDVTVSEGSTLTLEPGTQVSMSNDVAIMATGGTINILGTASHKVVIQPALPGEYWKELSAAGGGSMTIRHADVSGGPIRFLNGVTGLLEDSHVHHYSPSGSAIVNSVRADSVTVRRCHIGHYHETLFQLGLITIEDCLFEYAVNPSSDALDFDSAAPGSVIRRCTFRYGHQTNTDAIDIGPTAQISTRGVLIEDCLIHDFADKGISVGDGRTDQGATLGLTIRNCLIRRVARGIQVKGESWVTVNNCTIVDAEIGLHGFEKTPDTGGGIFTNTFNNILSDNQNAIVTEPDTFIAVHFSDTHGTNWPGTANLNLDPLFLDPANGDYRLRDGSPCRGTGLDGTDLGVRFPVGGVPATPTGLRISFLATDRVALAWDDTSPNETGFILEHASDGMNWVVAATAPADATDAVIALSLDPMLLNSFRVRATNFIGESFNSPVVSSNPNPDDRDGDGMPDNWESAHGLNPADPLDAHADPDGDGASNLEEFRAATDPRDPLSVLRFDSIVLSGDGVVQLRFEAQADRTYAVQFSGSPTGEGWQTLRSAPAESIPRHLQVADRVAPGSPTRYYRLVTP